ncbi:MAG: bifunctional glutamate N-acetyltransferase/amino-acid acetyltransferase ArgJ, partial [Trueperaceae bacterium]
MRLPAGFRAAGVAAGLKRSGRHDLGAVMAEEPAAWAFSGTRNVVRAACVDRNRAQHRSMRPVRAIVVNSGNANCATGEQGVWDNEDFAGLAAAALGLPHPHDVLTASTGVVGRQLPLDGIRAGLPLLAESFSEDGGSFAQAILTTDTVTKEVAADLSGGGRIVGMAKGSGMIHPNMATMLAFVLTDVEIDQRRLRELWAELTVTSFNQVTVDGDTSPNDMALVLASGRRQADLAEFAAALATVCRRLAQKIARDGEGATKLLSVEVVGAVDDEQARAAARTVAGSPLVKAAVHGNDPNWGRILVALGRAGASFDPAAVTISLQGTPVYRGAPV